MPAPLFEFTTYVDQFLTECMAALAAMPAHTLSIPSVCQSATEYHRGVEYLVTICVQVIG